MSAPSAPIDASLAPANEVYKILESSSVWRTENLGGGAATWTEVYTAAAFEAANDCTNCVFLRVAMASSTLVYVLANALKSGESENTAWMLVSNSKGATWNAYIISEGIIPHEYTVIYKMSVESGDGIVTFTHTHPRIGDSESTFNPWAVADRYTIIVGGSPPDWRFMTGSGTTIHDYSATDGTWNQIRGNGNDLLGSGGAAGEAYLDDYFGIGGWIHGAGVNRNMPKEETRIQYVFGATHGTGFCSVLGESFVFWNKPSPGMPRALAVAPTNTNWLYVGFNDKIMASETGGVTWYNLYTGHGAYDIVVDPQLAGAIYYWSTDGNLNLLVKGALGAEVLTLTSTGLMTETPYDAFGRIGRDPSSGRLLAIPNGTSLKMRNLGSTTELKTGLVSGCGLNVYPGQKLIMVDAANIWTCDDLYAGTPTISAKKGAWAAYANGVQAHRMVLP